MPFYTFISKAELHSFDFPSTQNHQAEILEGVRVPIICRVRRDQIQLYSKIAIVFSKFYLVFSLTRRLLYMGAMVLKYDQPINWIMCSKLKQEHLSRSPADLQQICERLEKEVEVVKCLQSNIAKKQGTEFLGCYDMTERKRGLWVSRKMSWKERRVQL